MARLALYLTDEERDFVKARPRGWMRELVQREMGSGLVGKGRAEQVIVDDVRDVPPRLIDMGPRVLAWKAAHPGKAISPEVWARLREEE